ncbi:uncharacterized protein HD556DRAFT_1441771 [Suillus plorans]|uniref:Uncharacterized protein n=1 Tax=Suillus plorans TaxID=116603 RepID=A0A9P7AVC6_9AGAM|nr:uncharacterized protein HD556DRAFT_1441771 [Suillus plorans]KAG1795942.1 hypothetical protein HD556DRAFT_1441771 [Suillus plorans]
MSTYQELPKSLWTAVKILAENEKKYQVLWAGCDLAGKPWPPSWVPKDGCAQHLVNEWKKARPQPATENLAAAALTATSKAQPSKRKHTHSTQDGAEISAELDRAKKRRSSFIPWAERRLMRSQPDAAVRLPAIHNTDFAADKAVNTFEHHSNASSLAATVEAEPSQSKSLPLKPVVDEIQAAPTVMHASWTLASPSLASLPAFDLAENLRAVHKLAAGSSKIFSFGISAEASPNNNDIFVINEGETGFDDATRSALESAIRRVLYPANHENPEKPSLSANDSIELCSGDESDETENEEEGLRALVAEQIEIGAERDEDVQIALDELLEGTANASSDLGHNDHRKASSKSSNCTLLLSKKAGSHGNQDGCKDLSGAAADVPLLNCDSALGGSECSIPFQTNLPAQVDPSNWNIDRPSLSYSHTAFQFPEVATIAPQSDVCLKNFGINLLSNPRRKRVWSGLQGFRSHRTTSLTLDDDNEAPPAINELEFNNLLESVNCGYLPDYGVILCKSLHNGTSCGYGVPLEKLMTHCYSSTRLADSSPRGLHQIPFCKTSKTPSALQIQFMKDILLNYPDIVATCGELRDLRPLPNQYGPILHIRPPIPGFVCPKCDYALPEACGTHLLAEHWNQHVEKKTLGVRRPIPIRDCFLKCPIQSFDQDANARTWFAVRRHQQWSSSNLLPSTRGEETSPASSMLASLLSRHQADIADSQVNEAAVVPFFLQVGAMKHIQPYQSKELHELVDLPRQSDTSLWKLKRAVTKRFLELCETVPNTNSVVRQLLVAPRSGEKGTSERFNVPARIKTRVSYALEEVRLISIILRCISDRAYAIAGSVPPLQPSSSKYRLTLNEEQLKAGLSLTYLLQNALVDDASLQEGISSLLNAVYMPRNTLQMFANSYVNPTIAYICLRSVHADGGFESPTLLTPYHVKTQFGIRLHVLGFINQEYQAFVAKNNSIRKNGAIKNGSKVQHKGRRMVVCSGDELDDADETLDAVAADDAAEWMKFVTDTIGRWVADQKISPFAIVREWIRALSRIARNTPSPAMVVWDQAGEQVRVHGHVIIVEQYKAALHSTLQDTIAFFHEKVLKGIQVSPAAFTLPTYDSYDQKTRSHGLFPLSLSDFQNPGNPASLFLDALASQGILCKVSVDGNIQWDPNQVRKWLADISGVLSQIYILLHMLSPPGRGTEEVLWQHGNSKESRRHLFLSRTIDTLVMIGNYDKGTYTSGVYKCIVRVIQYQVAELLAAFLRVVRPVELLLTLTSEARTKESKAEAASLYQTRLFVTSGKGWEPSQLSATIQEWYMKHLQLPIGMRVHRHFAQALQRVLYPRSGPLDENVRRLNDVANLAMGHGREAGEMHYAREERDILAVSQHEAFEYVGQDWLRFLNFEVTKPSSP